MKNVSFYSLNLQDTSISIPRYKKSVIKRCKRYKLYHQECTNDYQARFERAMTKKLQGDSIFSSFRIELSNSKDSSVKLIYRAYLRFGRNIFLNLLSMDYEPLSKIINDISSELDLSLIYEDGDVNDGGWQIVSNVYNSRPNRLEYDNIRNRLIHVKKFNGEVLDLWDENFHRQSIFSQQLSF